jgi:PAS domain S-box-containing protein
MRAAERPWRQALTFENTYDSVVVTGLDGAIIDSNAATERIFGYSKQEALGGGLELWYSTEDLERLRAGIAETLDRERRWTGEISFVRKDGGAGACEVVVVPLREEGGRLLGRIWIGHDITERTRAEAALIEARDAAEAASQTKSLFLANMSHELRTPLTAIIGYSDLLQREGAASDDTQLVSGLASIRAAGRHLLGLINAILDLSKIESSRMDLYP